jgi:riboflavin synthase
MFTGLVDDVGTIDRVASIDAGRELRVSCRYDDLVDGESISINGVCLTVREHGKGWFTCAAMITTRGLTTVEEWGKGDRVNLERSMRPSDRMGGHFVMGHVDGIARVTRVEPDSDALVIDLALPPGLSELTVERGSIALDGVSLTVAALPGPETVRVSIIEYTRRHTTLGALKAGDSVNVESDILAKYVQKALSSKI